MREGERGGVGRQKREAEEVEDERSDIDDDERRSSLPERLPPRRRSARASDASLDAISMRSLGAGHAKRGNKVTR